MPDPDGVTWAELEIVRPDLAQAGRDLFYQFGVGLAFLATIRRDGGPRLHPVCPVVAEGGLYAFIVPSPKRDDLERDRRYSMHSFPAEENEDAFCVTGVAVPRAGSALDGPLRDRFCHERDLKAPPPDFEEQTLFEFLVGGCLLTRTTGHGDPTPVHTVWRRGDVLT